MIDDFFKLLGAPGNIIKKTVHSALVFLVIVSCIALACIFFTSCSAKKKIIEREKLAVALSVEEVEVEVDEILKKETIAIATASSAVVTSSGATIEAEISDPEKEAFIIKEDLGNGTTKWTGKNLKNFKTGNQESTSVGVDTLSKKTEGQELSILKKKQHLKTELDLDSATKKVDVKKTSFFKSWWLWLLLAALIYGVISYFKKTLNPSEWISFK